MIATEPKSGWINIKHDITNNKNNGFKKLLKEEKKLNLKNA